MAGAGLAQNAVSVEPPTGGFGWLTRPYQQRIVPPINLANSDRLEALVRAGNLYLSAQDVIALALENNLDIEIQRYGPLLARENTRRAKGGGALRSVGAGVAAGPQSVSLSGVNVAVSNITSTAGAGVSSGGGIVTQLGPPIPLLDPQLNFYAYYTHATSPQSNLELTGTTALIVNSRTYQSQYIQNFDFGLSAQLTYSSQRSNVNSAFYPINPYTQGSLDLQVTQNLLQGFGRSVNRRNILVAKNNEKVTNLQFKQQVITTVAAVLNLYYDLISFNQDVRAKKDELATAQQLYEDNKKQVQIGTLAPIEVTRAESQVYASQQDLLVSQTNLLQQEIVLKNALSRNGVASPTIAEVHIIPLDQISVPESDNLKPINELVQDALDRRVEIAQSRINIDSSKVNLVGIKSSLHPTLQAFAELTDNGLTGPRNPLITPADSCTGSLAVRRSLPGGRVWQSSSADLPAQLPQLFGWIFIEYRSAKPRRTSRLRNQPIANPAERAAASKEHQSNTRRRSECGDRVAASAGPIRLLGEGAHSPATDARCRQEAVHARRIHGVSGGSRSADACRGRELGSAGARELQSRADRLRSSDRYDAGRESRLH